MPPSFWVPRQIEKQDEFSGFSGDGNLLLTYGRDGSNRVLALPEGNVVRSFHLDPFDITLPLGDELIIIPGRGGSNSVVRRGPLIGGEMVAVGQLEGLGMGEASIDGSGRWLAELRGGDILVRSLDALGSAPRRVGRHDGAIWVGPAVGPRVATMDASGEARIWSLVAEEARPERILHPTTGSAPPQDSFYRIRFAPSGRLAVVGSPNGSHQWELEGPPDAEPFELSERLEPGVSLGRPSITEDWVAFSTPDYGVMWPLRVPRARVLRPPGRASVANLAFSPDSRFLLSSHPEPGEVRLWPLSPEAGAASRRVYQDPYHGLSLEVDPRGRFFAVGGRGAAIVPLEGGAPRKFQGEGVHWLARLDKEGRRLAAYADWESRVRGRIQRPKTAHVYVWDIETGHNTDLNMLAIEEDCAKGNALQGLTWGLEFLADGTLLTDGFGGLRVWDLAHGTSRPLRPCDPASFCGALDVWHSFTLSRDGRLGVRVLSWTDPTAPSIVTVVDIASGNDREITSHGNRVWKAALDPTGRILVTGDKDGLVRVGPVTGEEPHLLFGHSGRVNDVAVSPDGKWIASASEDGTIRLWPMPEGPPLHTLPYETLLQKLHALTNLRVVPDPASEMGYKLEIGPFPGWANFPEW